MVCRVRSFPGGSGAGEQGASEDCGRQVSVGRSENADYAEGA